MADSVENEKMALRQLALEKAIRTHSDGPCDMSHAKLVVEVAKLYLSFLNGPQKADK